MLLSKPIKNFPNIAPFTAGKIYFSNRQIVRGHRLPTYRAGARYVFKGQFERFEYLMGHEEEVKFWATPVQTISDGPRSNDLVVSIRRGWNKWPADTLCPSQEYYAELLAKFEYKSLYICTDSPEDPYFQKLNRLLNFKFYKGTTVDQFNFIMKSERYIMAPSTFSFLASFVGHGAEVFWPNIWALDNAETDYDWFPRTEARFIRIEV
jgi:hypothetical protein